MIEREQEFRELVKAVHDAVDEYSEARLNNEQWFERGLDGKLQTAMHRLLAFQSVRHLDSNVWANKFTDDEGHLISVADIAGDKETK